MFLVENLLVKLSEKKLPDLFDDTETSITEAWEKSGSLVNSLESLSDDYKKIHNLRSKIKGSINLPNYNIFIFNCSCYYSYDLCYKFYA